ncbi:MAG: hypothetical protein Q8O14_08420 [bacterium]|jgi:hypothetical protein|nr:hypothetical protein [bacterium]
MIKQKTNKPVMVSFRRSVGELRLLGLVAWGGLCLDLAGLRGRDVALRLGAPRMWMETMLEAVAQAGSRQLVLVDLDLSVFLGDPSELAGRLETWAARQGVRLTRLSTQGLSAAGSARAA